ncbi:hypothetical protein MIND_00314100 [Mycena indigotica]|uniref:Chitin synthase export chaperone n=1 Tax=Mycena indigotica TaxID=2126181 RepID=A0A8H6T0H3_9AGAR|nr:uncharacterized protein MIND_00314100 [Mycena indigotica]KAF7309433.1 hypothetical protein MIND_00314100 [Mycena indigotica]
MTRFGDFDVLCRDTPSYTWCNLFYRQVLKKASDILTDASLPTASAGLGVNPTCSIPRMGHDGSLGNIANIVVCALSLLFTGVLIWATNRRKAAVGRIELRTFLLLYFITLPLQLITTGSFLEQGSTSLVALTAVHAGFVAALFWALLANALVATQVVEDGTPSSLIPFYFFAVCFFAATTYISFDVALTITSTFGPSNPPSALHSIPLFVFTSIWPAASTLIYFGIMTYIVLAVLNEVRPMWFYILSAALFVLSQLAYFLLSRVICKGSSQKIDGSFVATILETAAVGVLYLAWKSITEESWDEDPYYAS